MTAEMQSTGHSSIDYDIESDQLNPKSRHALLHIPSQPPREFESHTQFSNPEYNQDAIVVYPEGIKLQWTGDPESPPREEIDDISFILTLIDHLHKDYFIDQNRVYVAGFSNGGGLADLLAGDLRASSRIAAFAMSSAAVYQDAALKEPLFSRCHPSRLPIPILEFHGDSDPVIHYDGATTPDGPSYPVMNWLQDWATRNGCGVTLRCNELYDGNVERFAWFRDDRDDQDLVVHYKIHGFGHGWPTTWPLNNDEQRHGPTYFNATPIVLDFFRHASLIGGVSRLDNSSIDHEHYHRYFIPNEKKNE